MIGELATGLMSASAGLPAVTGVGLWLAGLYAWRVEPTWLRTVRVRVPVRRLPAAFEGFTIAHLSDLHHSKGVTVDYLRRAVATANAAGADLIALTGDYITRGERWVEGVAEAVSGLRAPAGVYAVMGNHDYHGDPSDHRREGRTVRRWGDERLADRLAESFRRGGVRVLRNEADEIRRGGQTLQLAGLDDLWSRRFDPEAAMRGLRRDAPVIAMSHNPDTWRELASRGADLVLSGHTHGGQISLPICGPVIRACRDRRLTRGLYALNNCHLYINPGIGYLHPVRFNCRPEITLLSLSKA
jgi:predicted MPP superfamily phosphohydrolase